MGFGHWLKGATRIRFDDRTLGNVLKNGAMVGGTAVGGPLGLAIGAAGGVAGQAALGGNLGESLNAGLKGATNTGLAQAGKGFLSNAIHSGAPAVPSLSGPSSMSVGAPTPGAINPGVSNLTGGVTHGMPLPSVSNLTTASHVAPTPGFFSKALDAGKGVAEWAGNHDKTTSALLSGVGDVLDPTQERLQKAQAQALERQTAESEYDYNQKKARDLALEPLRQALYGSLGQQVGNNYSAIAKNPYQPAGA